VAIEGKCHMPKRTSRFQRIPLERVPTVVLDEADQNRAVAPERQSMRRKSSREDVSSNPEYCGFVCPGCHFRLRLSDPTVAGAVVELFKRGADVASLECTECGQERHYRRDDLQMFLSGGPQATFRTDSKSKRVA